MEYTFTLNPEDQHAENIEFDNDFHFVYEMIEDDIEIENHYGDYDHPKINIIIKADKEIREFINTLLSYELPTPKCENKEDGISFFTKFTVIELKENTAKVELEYIPYFNKLDNKPEILWNSELVGEV